MSFVKKLRKGGGGKILPLLACIFIIASALIVFSLEFSNKKNNFANLQANLELAQAPASYTLFVFKVGAGSVASVPSGVSCGSICSASFNKGTSVILTAAPDSGYTFRGWSGACSGTGTCTVAMTSAKSVTATFLTSSAFLVVFKSGTGTGTVTSSPSGINCGSACSTNYNSGTSVTLTATALSGSVFAGWSGACSGTGKTCIVKMSTTKAVTANFTTVATWYPCSASTCTSSSSCGYIKGSGQPSITRTCPTGTTVITGRCIPMSNNSVASSYKSGNGWYCRFRCNSGTCLRSDGCALVQCQ